MGEERAPSSQRPSPIGVLQHERFVLWVLLRYLPFVLGAVMAVLFGSSVVHDADDVAHCAWNAGADMLGDFGRFGRALIVPIFVVSAFFRRGARRMVRIVEIGDEALVFEDEAGRTARIPREAVRSTFRFSRGDGTDTIVFEVQRGVLRFGILGDRISLTLAAESAREIEARFRSASTTALVGTRSPRFGGAIAAASLVLGAVIGALFYRWIHGAMLSLPRASYYVPIVPDAAGGWLAGLTVVSMGVVHGGLSYALCAPAVTLGQTRLEIAGPRDLRIPYARIASVEVERRRLVIELDDERRVERWCIGADPARLEGLAAAIRERVEAARDERAVPDGLERGDAPVAEWRKGIEARAAAPRYRVGALNPDALAACILSPSLPRDVRVGAALALSACKEAGPGRRLREVADEVAPPTLRALVEHLADGEADDAMIADALARRRARRA